MVLKRLQKYLDEHNADYKLIQHDMAFTAIEIARSADIPIREMAKTVVVRIDGNPTMVVVPANYKVKMELLKKVFDTKQIEMVGESELSQLFPDCEVGAMPPFGGLYDMPVYITESLTEDNEIAFNAGCHSEVVTMPYRSYEQLVEPNLVVLNN